MDCRYFDGYSAPLCPRDEGAADRTWFADEDICRLSDVPAWIKRQRKIAKNGSFEDGYFTVAMLKQDCRISKGMKGVDPDGTDEKRTADEAAWFKAHPAFTEEQRAKMKADGEKKKAVLYRARLKKAQLNIGPEALPGKNGIQVPLSGNTP